MIFIAASLALLALLVWAGRRGRPMRLELRLASAFFAATAAVGAVVAGLKGGWVASLMLVGVSAWLGQTAAIGRTSASRPNPDTAMTIGQARQILGLEEGADQAGIDAAYKRLMQRAHPDRGGSTGLAAQLNAARDRLLRRP